MVGLSNGNIAGFVQEIQKVLANTDNPSFALALAEWLARFLSQVTLGIYRCDFLEEAVLSKLDISAPHPTRIFCQSMHVVTEVYAHGGHTNFLRQVLQISNPSDQVLITGRTSAAEAARILGVELRRIICVETSDPIAAISEAANALICCSEVYLYIHPDDMKSALAVRLAKKVRSDLKIGFINHADHAFSTGIGIADCVFEISMYGWQLRQNRNIIDRASFVGIPIEYNSFSKPSPTLEQRMLGTGAPYKFRPWGGSPLIAALQVLLSKNSELELELIGPSPEDQWWQPLLKAFGSRIKFYPALSHDQYLERLRNCAVYFDSFPRAGGTAFPEALVMGLDVIGLKGGTFGYSCADALRVDTEQDFVATVENILRRDRNTLAFQAEIRALCILSHSPRTVISRMHETMTSGVLFQPPEMLLKNGYPPILAESALDQGERVRLPLPARNTRWSLRIHVLIACLYAKHFGYLSPECLRLFVRLSTRVLEHAIGQRVTRSLAR